MPCRRGLAPWGCCPGCSSTHIAWDIGAAAVTRALAAAYGAPALLGGWSRLLIDLNRGADDPTIVMKLSDGSIIPGNRDADADEVARRIAAYHAPYHAAITRELDGMGPDAVIVSCIPSRPAWKGVPRPWAVGVLYDRDARLAAPLMARLEQAGFAVGDNEPYHGALDGDTLNVHGISPRAAACADRNTPGPDCRRCGGTGFCGAAETDTGYGACRHEKRAGIIALHRAGRAG